MFNLYSHTQSELKSKITKHYRAPEKECVDELLKIVTLDDTQQQKATLLARRLIMNVRDKRTNGLGVDALMQQFKLSSVEGIALMCLAESLLRIPDKFTQDELIRDKISHGDWHAHTQTRNIFLNAASWGLTISGRLTRAISDGKLANAVVRAIAKGGEPLIRKAMQVAVKLVGNQFVMAETIENALKKAIKEESRGYLFSYDMLGEAAMTEDDARLYLESYINAIHATGKAAKIKNPQKCSGVSIKLSALYSRYSRDQYPRVMRILYPRVKELFLLAKEYQIGLFIDAEETERLEISLEILERLVADPDLNGYSGIGFVVQSYQKRAPHVIKYIIDLASRNNTRLMVRLVKGAYWDSEIKKAQQDGELDYPVYTRKFYTDLSFLACATIMLDHQSLIYPAFATHNAMTLAMVYYMADGKEFEFQALFGMGETLYDNVVGEDHLNVLCRIYAPVGNHKTLLAYLVRRLLENGANTSFVHQIVDKKVSLDELLANPLIQARKAMGASNPHFKKPLDIYPNNRINSRGLDLSDEILLNTLQEELNTYAKKEYMATSLITNHKLINNEAEPVISPALHVDQVGVVVRATIDDIPSAVNNAANAYTSWAHETPQKRADYLLKMADLLEENYVEIMSLLVREAGKTLHNAISEVREAVDFCRYYAHQVIREFNNETHKPLGVIVCISPWNFPLAIFLGEVSSALVTGNTVIAKPSDQTNLIAYFAVKLFHKAGVPEDVLQLVLGSGSKLGNALTLHQQVVGVIFTGSTSVAQLINRNLAKRQFTPVLIAETGGQNTMIVDSSSLKEQVVSDVLSSAFDSAGQRCSALRVLYLQEEIADEVILMLKGAMDELIVGNPVTLATDVGPVIDSHAQLALISHIDNMRLRGRKVYQAILSSDCNLGTYVAPTLIEIDSIKELESEMFGPILHVIRYSANSLDNVIADINATGYGLTQGLHSRINGKAQFVYERINAGNIYVNRNMVGAVVGVQPFGGEGLSGTGPKAGGDLYLYRLVETFCSPYSESVYQLHYSFGVFDRFVASLSRCNFTHGQKQQLFAYAEEQRAASPLNRKVSLVGPTGEDNFVIAVKRGLIACFAITPFEYAKQIIALLATDNRAVLPTDDATSMFKGILPRESFLSENMFEVPEVKAALITSSRTDNCEIRQKLAGRDGVIVVIVPENQRGEYNLHWLTVERAISINTTATGGNTQLMSIIDKI